MSGVEDVETSGIHSEEPEETPGFISSSQERDEASETGISSTTYVSSFRPEDEDNNQDLYRGAEDLVNRVVAEAPVESRERSSEEPESEKHGEKQSVSDFPPATDYPLLQSWNRRVLYVIYWRDMKLSGQMFLIGFVLLLAMMRYNMLHVMCLATMSTLIVAFVWRACVMALQALKKTPLTNPMQPYLDIEIEIPEDKVIGLAKTFSSHLLCVAKHFRSLLLIDDVVRSLKFGVNVWVLSYIAACFSGLTLFTIGFLVTFSVPALYERNQERVDTHLAKVKKHVDDTFEKLQKRFPILGKLKKQ